MAAMISGLLFTDPELIVRNLHTLQKHFLKISASESLQWDDWWKKKGIEYSIRAVAHLLKQGMEVEYEIIGDGSQEIFCRILLMVLGPVMVLNS